MICKCFSVNMPHWSDVLDGKDVSAARRGVGRRQPCITCHSTSEGGVRCKKSSGCKVAETIDTIKRVVEEQTGTAGLGERGRSTKTREVQSEIGALRFQQSLLERSFFLQDLCGSDGLVVEDFYSITTFQPLHSIHLEVSGLLEPSFVHDLFFFI